jgi:hypothetical protein
MATNQVASVSHAELVWFRAALVLLAVAALPSLLYGGFEFYLASALQQRADAAWHSATQLDSGGHLGESCAAAARGPPPYSWTDSFPRRPGPTDNTEYMQSPATKAWLLVPKVPTPPPASAAVCADYSAKIDTYIYATRARRLAGTRAYWQELIYVAATSQQLGEVIAVPDCLQATQRHRVPSVACEIGDRVNEDSPSGVGGPWACLEGHASWDQRNNDSLRVTL